MDKHTSVHIHTMEYYSAIKRKELLIHTMMWVNLKNILNERNLTQNSSYCMIPFMWSLIRRITNEWWKKSEQCWPPGWRWELTGKEYVEAFWGNTLYLNLEGIWVMQVCMHLSKMYQMINLKFDHFIVYKFFLKKKNHKPIYSSQWYACMQNCLEVKCTAICNSL